MSVSFGHYASGVCVLDWVLAHQPLRLSVLKCRMSLIVLLGAVQYYVV